MDKKRKIKILHLVLLILMVGIFAYVGMAEKAGKGAYCSGDVVQLSDGWILNDGKEIRIPAQLENYHSPSIKITRKLEEVDSVDTLVISSKHTILEVYIDEERIYEFGKEMIFFQIPVMNWNVIPMKKEYSGKQLTIVNTAKSEPYKGNVDVIYLGDKMAIFVYIMGKNLMALTCSSLIFSISLIVMALWFVTRKRQESIQILYLAVFGFSVSFWELLDVRIPQLFFGKPEFFSMITFEILMVLPIPFILFYSYFSWEDGCEIEWISLISCADFFLSNLLQFFRIMDVSQTVLLSHLAIISSFLILCYMNFQFRKRRKGEKRFHIEIIGFAILSLTVSVDLLRYYFRQVETGLSYLGLLIYIICLILYISKRFFSNIMKGKKAEIYEELAYHDKMTGLWNRTAYQEYLKKLLDLGMEKTLGYGVFAFDLNNLKKINDRYGHDRGDQFIRDNAEYLRKEMENIGQVYRTGGDEFICIFDPSAEEQARNCAGRLEEQVRKGRDARINFSFGFAVCEKDKDKSFEDTIRRADVAMYAYKRRHKAERVE